jgi:hypothetical protein
LYMLWAALYNFILFILSKIDQKKQERVLIPTFTGGEFSLD